MTCTAHLARSLVIVGQSVRRGEPFAVSGYSGLDGAVTFPWGTPHIHFNTWLDAEPVDPFPLGAEPSLWRAGELPEPIAGVGVEDAEPSIYDPEHVEAAIAACVTERSRRRMRALSKLDLRAAEVIAEMNYYPTRFPTRVSPYAREHGREPTLDLPFSATEFDGVSFVDLL